MDLLTCCIWVKLLFQILVSSRFWFPSKSPLVVTPGRDFEQQTILGYFLGLTSMSKDPSKPPVSGNLGLCLQYTVH